MSFLARLISSDRIILLPTAHFKKCFEVEPFYVILRIRSCVSFSKRFFPFDVACGRAMELGVWRIFGSRIWSWNCPQLYRKRIWKGNKRNAFFINLLKWCVTCNKAFKKKLPQSYRIFWNISIITFNYSTKSSYMLKVYRSFFFIKKIYFILHRICLHNKTLL